MKKLELFKPEDFGAEIYQLISAENAKDLANKKLNEWLEEQQVVYGSLVNTNCPDSWSNFSSPITKEGPCSFDTHKALLVNIEEIEKECNHEPHIIVITKYEKNYDHTKVREEINMENLACCKCGIKLKPTGWEPVE